MALPGSPRLFVKLWAKVQPYSGSLATILHALVLAAVGWYGIQWREILWPRIWEESGGWAEASMDWFQRTSYDLPFVFRELLPGSIRAVVAPKRSTDEAVIVYMDEDSYTQLDQSPSAPWSRALHARLVRRLTKDGARAVFFDVVFDSESPDDPAFAAALAANKNVFLGATFNTNSEKPLTPDEAERYQQVGLASEQLSKPTRVLSKAARGWGLLVFRPVDSDYGVRRLYPGKLRQEGLDPWPVATWQMAQALGAQLPKDNKARFSRRWVNYYGPGGTVDSVSYYRPLMPDGGVPDGFFKDKVVFVGGRSQLGTGARKLLDEFSTPWSHFRDRAFTPGTEIHANIFLNLLHHEWLERLPFSTEEWFVLLFGLALGALRWLQPWRVIGLGVFGAIAIVVVACLMQWHARLWWNWTVPVFVQLPLGVFLAVASRYYLEERRKRKLRSAFGFYLSPDLASEIAERDFVLAPGGEKVLATMIFTDLEGFTTLSEKLGDSARLGEELTRYFTRTTDEILAEKGTVIKFIGDAVFAAWGAPLPQADQAERAVRAAWKLAQVSEMDVSVPHADGTTGTVHVRTRIGIHTGEALAGNLGSARRFDYTLIGDAVNFAARLEGANKYTGTTILLSDDTAGRLGGKFLLRRLGAFKVKGKAKSVVIHELLGDNPAIRPPWLDWFEAALAAWTSGDLAAARVKFEAVKTARGGTDGPSQFYLDRIDGLAVAAGWTGEVELEGK
jgi:adenylate cyclase